MKYELVNFCEFDRYATQSYCAIHSESEGKNLGDITKVNEKEMVDFNIMTWGFPCTDISIAGNQKGFIDENGNKTRSGLYYDGLRILKEKQPALSIIENVKALTQNKFKAEFEQILKDLTECGYNNYYQVLNAKNYGIPQNRERIFIISIRKDIDNGSFKFPEGFDNGIRLKDILEKEVDKKYYLSEEVQKRFKYNNKKSNNDIIGTTKPDFRTIGQRDLVYGTDGVMGCLVATDYKQPKQIIEVNLKIIEPTVCEQRCDEGLRFFKDNVCGKIRTIDAGGDKRIVEPSSPKLVGGGIGEINFGKQYRQGNRVYSSEETDMCLLSQPVGNAGGNSYLYTEPKNEYKIRKLTPLECWRLMGFLDEDFYKAKNSGMSDTQLYKQAGNSIVVNVLYYILLEIYKTMPYLLEDIKLSSFFSGIGAFEGAILSLMDAINSGIR